MAAPTYPPRILHSHLVRLAITLAALFGLMAGPLIGSLKEFETGNFALDHVLVGVVLGAPALLLAGGVRLYRSTLWRYAYPSYDIRGSWAYRVTFWQTEGEQTPPADGTVRCEQDATGAKFVLGSERRQRVAEGPPNDQIVGTWASLPLAFGDPSAPTDSLDPPIMQSYVIAFKGTRASAAQPKVREVVFGVERIEVLRRDDYDRPTLMRGVFEECGRLRGGETIYTKHRAPPSLRRRILYRMLRQEKPAGHSD